MKILDLPFLIRTLLVGLGWTVAATAAQQTAPIGFYSVELQPGSQVVGISVLNPTLLAASVTSVSGNRVRTTASNVDAGSRLNAAKHYYLELVSGPSGVNDPLTGQRFEVDAVATIDAATAAGELVVDLTSPRSTSSSLSGLPGGRLELREHLTLNQVFPKERLFASTNFAEADQVQFFDGSGFDVCYVYGRNDGLAQWTAQKGFHSEDARVIPPGTGVVFKRSQRSPGSITLILSGVARTTPFVQPLVPGNNLVAEGFPAASSFTQRSALPGAYQNADLVKVYESSGFATYRLYSRGTAPSDNIWVTVGDPAFTPVNDTPLFDYRSAVFLKLKNGNAGYRYSPPFSP